MHRHALPLIASLALASTALAQTTAFTVQGELANAGAPANGLHDVRFRLFDALTSGTQIGATQCLDNASVVNGKFTALVDFGAQFASTADRYLEIEVRADTGLNCTNVTGYTVLSPRQRLTPTPRATAATTANALSAPDGSPSNAVVVDNAGNVGVGTTAPIYPIHVASTLPALALQDTDSAGTAGGQQVGFLSFRDNTNVERGWFGYGGVGDPDISIVNARTSGDIILNPFSGNVGIGTTGPLSRLDVRGDIRLGSSGQYFAVKSPSNDRTVRGQVNFNGTIDAARSTSGFTVTHSGVGTYVINFSPAFASPPTVVATNTAVCCRPRLSQSQTTFATIFMMDGATGALTDTPFHFIAMGP
jgi:hypothetical protein